MMMHRIFRLNCMKGIKIVYLWVIKRERTNDAIGDGVKKKK